MAHLEAEGEFPEIPPEFAAKILGKLHLKLSGSPEHTRGPIENDLFTSVVNLKNDLIYQGKTPEEIEENLRWIIDVVPELLQRRAEWEALRKRDTTLSPEVSQEVPRDRF